MNLEESSKIFPAQKLGCAHRFVGGSSAIQSFSLMTHSGKSARGGLRFATAAPDSLCNYNLENCHLQIGNSFHMLRLMEIHKQKSGMGEVARSVDDLIRLAGGPKALSEESAKTPKRIGTYAVHKWRRNGIPDAHWELFLRIPGVSADTIYRANAALRHQCAA